MKRYDKEEVGPAYQQCTMMVEHSDGDWVYYDDVAALLELNKELVEDLELLLKASKNKELPPPFWVNDAQAKAEAFLFHMKELKND